MADVFASKAVNGSTRSDLAKRLGVLEPRFCPVRRKAADVAKAYRSKSRSYVSIVTPLTPEEYQTFLRGFIEGKVTYEEMKRVKALAFKKADERFPPYCSPKDAENSGNFSQNDGHNDAFRHTYWNALMVKNFGFAFAEDFATAHESSVGNPYAREAMDLYNNEQGRKIAARNPKASEDDLAKLVSGAVSRGEVMVIDKTGILRWSDEIAFREHGFTTRAGSVSRPD